MLLSVYDYLLAQCFSNHGFAVSSITRFGGGPWNLS